MKSQSFMILHVLFWMASFLFAADDELDETLKQLNAIEKQIADHGLTKKKLQVYDFHNAALKKKSSEPLKKITQFPQKQPGRVVMDPILIKKTSSKTQKQPDKVAMKAVPIQQPSFQAEQEQLLSKLLPKMRPTIYSEDSALLKIVPTASTGEFIEQNKQNLSTKDTKSPAASTRVLPYQTQQSVKSPLQLQKKKFSNNSSESNQPMVVARPVTLADLQKQESQFSEKFITGQDEFSENSSLFHSDEVLIIPPSQDDSNHEKQIVETKTVKVQSFSSSIDPLLQTQSIAQSLTQKSNIPKSAKDQDSLPKLQPKSITQKFLETTINDDKDSVYTAMPVSMITTKDSPSLQFSGDICSFLGTSMQDDTRNFEDGDPHLGFGWADLYMEVTNSVLNDFQLKYKIKLQIVPDDVAVEQNYFEVHSPYGTVQIGNVRGPEYCFIENATSLLGGTGGVDGSCFDMFNKVPGLPNLHYQAGSSKYATKLIYYTARMLGWQLGLGFCPNPNHMGWGSMGSKDYDPGIDSNLFSSENMRRRMNLSLGINFEQNVDDFTFKTALVAIKEKSTLLLAIQREVPGEHDYDPFITYDINREIPLKQDVSYQASTSVQYKNFQIAAGFINNGALNLPTRQKETEILEKYGLHLGDCGKSWNVGGKYSVGCIDVGLAYNKMKRHVTGYNHLQGEVTALTVDYQIIPGIKFFAEIEHIKNHSDERIAALYGNEGPVKNSGMVLMIGSKISF